MSSTFYCTLTFDTTNIQGKGSMVKHLRQRTPIRALVYPLHVSHYLWLTSDFPYMTGILFGPITAHFPDSTTSKNLIIDLHTVQCSIYIQIYCIVMLDIARLLAI